MDRRGCDLNVCSEKERPEKLNYLHNNPLRRSLAAQPGDSPRSRRGGRFYYLGDRSAMAMDRMP